MLIGQVMQLSFADYAREAMLPVAAGLRRAVGGAGVAGASRRAAGRPRSGAARGDGQERDRHSTRWQTFKGLFVALALVAVFLFTAWPRDVAALVGAGVLLLSRRFQTSKMMAMIDWPLLVLFMGLFIVNHALADTGTRRRRRWPRCRRAGSTSSDPPVLFGATLLLSNLLSNVPAVMLLLPAADGPHAGATLALVSTLAGNLLIVGSIAEHHRRRCRAPVRIKIDWKMHARVGVPVALLTLAIAGAWMIR